MNRRIVIVALFAACSLGACLNAHAQGLVRIVFASGVGLTPTLWAIITLRTER